MTNQLQNSFNSTSFNTLTFNGGYASGQLIQAKGNIFATTTKTIICKAAILRTFTQTVTSKAELLITTTKTIEVKSNIFATTIRTVNAKGAISRTFTQTITSKARIQLITSQTVTVKGNIINPYEYLKTVRQISSLLEIQWDGVNWTDETDYLISAIGNEKLWKTTGEGIASTLDVELDNTTERFTPGNISSPIYTYLKPRVNIRISVLMGGYTTRMFTGYIKNIHPDTKSSVCSLDCFDNQVLIYNKRTNGIVYEDYRSDQLLEVLANLAGLEAAQYNFDVGVDVVNFGYFEERNVWPIMGEIAVAERGRIFFNRNGILTFWNRDRLHNLESVSPILTLNDWIIDLDYSVAEHEIKNAVTVKATPRSNAGVQVVWTTGNAEYLDPYSDTLVFIPAHSSQVAWIELEDPCTTFITPVANTDYTANSTQDGSGDDLTGNISIHEFINYGNAVFINVINSGDTDAYLTKFQVRGNPVIILKWIKVVAKDDGSINLYGRQDFEIENHFIDSEDAAREIAEEELYRRKDAINLFRINIVGIPDLLCGDVVSVEHRSSTFKDFMIDQLDWTLDDRGFRETLTLVNPYIFPSIQRIEARGNIV